MTFTPPDPSSPTYPTALERVREAVGDVDQTINPKLQCPDELIDYFIDTFGEQRATLETLNDILARYAREADTGTRAAGLDATRRFERLLELRRILLEKMRTTVAPGSTVSGAFIAAPYLSKATARGYRDDTDFNQGSKLRVGMNDSDMPDN